MGILGAIWGLTGVFLLLASAVYRLCGVAFTGLSSHLLWYQWTFLVLCVLLMAYAEGYRAFQRRFSPRVAARAKYLRDHGNVLHALLGPFFCMGFIHATKRRRITSISVTAGIVVLILLVRLLSQPWRGIIDLSVVVGLVWGLVSLVIFTFRAFTLDTFDYSPEVPEEEYKAGSRSL